MYDAIDMYVFCTTKMACRRFILCVITIIYVFIFLHNVESTDISNTKQEDEIKEENRAKLNDLLPVLSQELYSQAQNGAQFFAIILPPQNLDLFELLPLPGQPVTNRAQVYTEGYNYIVSHTQETEVSLIQALPIDPGRGTT